MNQHVKCSLQDEHFILHTASAVLQVKRAAGSVTATGHAARGQRPPLPFRLLVVSYDYIGKMTEMLQQLKFGCVLLDEAHYIKNHTVGTTVVKHYRQRK
jgi:hypothetical protein